MASWLKVAEDLLEVVDRRAKLAVSDLNDEQSDSQPSASNGQEVKARRTKSKEKGQSRQTSTETKKNSNLEKVQKSILLSAQDLKIDRDESYPFETPLEDGTNHTEEVSVEQLLDTYNDRVLSDTASPGITQTNNSENDTGVAITVPIAENNFEITSSSTSDDVMNVNSEVLPESSSSAFVGKESEAINGDHPADANPIVSSVDGDTSLKVNQVSPESETLERHSASNNQENEGGRLPEPSPNMNKQDEQKSGNTPIKVQEQLDEAQGLLKSAVSTGQSKEARLARVCAGLSTRLQEYKSENAQLEELLVSERERSTSYGARIKQLQQDLSASKLEVSRVESNMSEALAAKNLEISSLVGSMEALKKQASASEGKLASLQANMEAMVRNRELTETRMMQVYIFCQ